MQESLVSIPYRGHTERGQEELTKLKNMNFTTDNDRAKFPSLLAHAFYGYS